MNRDILYTAGTRYQERAHSSEVSAHEFSPEELMEAIELVSMAVGSGKVKPSIAAKVQAEIVLMLAEV